jgi:hemerythrin-like domain-containing protein
MKRNENLKTLSWEHHDGLVVAFRLQQGLKKGAAIPDMARYILHIWDNTLRDHFQREEQTINPNLEQRREGKPLVEQMMGEHKSFKNIITQIKNDQTGRNSIDEFAKLLNHHIRFEERELFPMLERLATKEELAKIGQALGQIHHRACNAWQPRFWQKTDKV